MTAKNRCWAIKPGGNRLAKLNHQCIHDRSHEGAHDSRDGTTWGP